MDDLPSPLTALVITTTVHPGSVLMEANRVAATLNCSATTESGLHLVTRVNSRGKLRAALRSLRDFPCPSLPLSLNRPPRAFCPDSDVPALFPSIPFA